MEHLYVILNKSYHDALLKVAFGENPLRFVDSVAIYCPEDPTQNRVLDFGLDQFRGGKMPAEFVGHTTILY